MSIRIGPPSLDLSKLDATVPALALEACVDDGRFLAGTLGIPPRRSA